MRKTLIWLATAACMLVGLSAYAQDMSLTRLDCGTPQAPTPVNQRFSDTFAYGDLKLQFVFSCYLIKHGDEYLLWDTGHSMSAPPAPRTFCASACETSGRTVLISMKSRPRMAGSICAYTAFTAAASASMLTTVSLAAASSAGVLATFNPVARALSALRFQTIISCPRLASRAAMPAPILPMPATPIFMC